MSDVRPAPGAKRRLAARLPLLAVWIVAAVPFVQWLVFSADPETTVAASLVAEDWLSLLLTGTGLAVALALLFYPPFPAWCRLVLHRMRLSFSTDRGPLLRALGELQHFETAQRHLEVGRLALQIGQLETAAPHLARAVELDPLLASAQYHWGRFLLGQGALQQALDAFTRAESAESGHAFGDALLLAGRCLHLLGRDRDAAGVLREHARRHGGNRRSQYWLGEALLELDDPDGARAAFVLAAAPAKTRLDAEENWFRALARVRLWRLRSSP